MIKTLKTIVITIGILVFGYWTFIGIKYNPWKDDEIISKCGVVQKVLETERPAKYRLVTELYLGIKYDSGEFEATQVDATTFMKHPVGSRICFEEKDTSNFGKKLLAEIYWLTIASVLLVLLLYWIIWLFQQENEE